MIKEFTMIDIFLKKLIKFTSNYNNFWKSKKKLKIYHQKTKK